MAPIIQIEHPILPNRLDKRAFSRKSIGSAIKAGPLCASAQAGALPAAPRQAALRSRGGRDPTPCHPPHPAQLATGLDHRAWRWPLRYTGGRGTAGRSGLWLHLWPFQQRPVEQDRPAVARGRGRSPRALEKRLIAPLLPDRVLLRPQTGKSRRFRGLLLRRRIHHTRLPLWVNNGLKLMHPFTSGVEGEADIQRSDQAIHSANFDHLLVSTFPLTAIPIAFLWPTKTTSFLPLVMPV